jgi:hypothetical protein
MIIPLWTSCWATALALVFLFSVRSASWCDECVGEQRRMQDILLPWPSLRGRPQVPTLAIDRGRQQAGPPLGALLVVVTRVTSAGQIYHELNFCSC